MLLARQQSADFDFEDAPEPHRAARLPQARATAVEPDFTPSHYTGSSRRPAMLLIAVAHIAAIALFVKYDVLDVAHKRADPIMIELQPLAEAPPPQPQPRQETATKPVETPIVAPPPLVQTPVAAAPVATTPVAPPPTPQPSAAPGPVAPAPAVVAAPIIPPDASAANLGNVAPRYPVESRRAHEEGTVRLRVLISADGAVEQITVAKSSGYDRLDKAALDTVRGWRFRAGTQAGKAVEAVGYLSIPFVLSH